MEEHLEPEEKGDGAVQPAAQPGTSLIDRLRSLVQRDRLEGPRRLKVHVILNPAAGQDAPVLKLLNEALNASGVDWDIFITKQSGDAARFARQAVAARADRLVVYGGDGTVAEAASGLLDSTLPMAIIPGGTANVISIEAGIPGDLAEACALAVHPAPGTLTVDIAKAGEHFFLLRAGMGLEAAMVEGADRELKNRLGVFAYALAGLHALANPPTACYRLTLDGETVETEGVTCIVANSGATGLGPGFSLAPEIYVDDGLLDVLVLRKADLAGLVSAAASVIGKSDAAQVHHWQAREVTVEADPPQTVQADGEPAGETPLSIRLIPRAVRLVVPAASGPAQGAE